MRASRFATAGVSLAWLVLIWGQLSSDGALHTAWAEPLEPQSLSLESLRTAPADATFSMIAVGDTGAPVEWSLEQQAVGNSMQAEDRRAPIDVVLLLGDNFYPHGLLRRELSTRIRDNLIAPYCPFLQLEGSLSAHVSAACDPPPRPTHPVSFYALLGNHDHEEDESVRMQRRAVPLFVSNWKATAGLVQIYQVDSGVSLIAVDSMDLLAGADPTPIVRAIRAAPGPWRILAAHHPLVSARGAGYTDNRSYAQYRETLRHAIDAAGVPVQLFLSGHDHYLAATMDESGAPPLNIIAGSGSSTRDQEIPEQGCLFRRSRVGFARVDLVGESGDERMVAMLIASLDATTGAGQVVAGWSVDRLGRIAERSLSSAAAGACQRASDPLTRGLVAGS